MVCLAIIQRILHNSSDSKLEIHLSYQAMIIEFKILHVRNHDAREIRITGATSFTNFSAEIVQNAVIALPFLKCGL